MPTKRYKQTIEHRKKISLNHTGKKYSLEARKNMSLAQIKLYKEGRGNWSNGVPIEIRKKISRSLKNRKYSKTRIDNFKKRYWLKHPNGRKMSKESIRKRTESWRKG